MVKKFQMAAKFVWTRTGGQITPSIMLDLLTKTEQQVLCVNNQEEAFKFKWLMA
jgi:hypothetical protein